MATQWDRWLRGGRHGAPPKQADPRLAAGEFHPLPADDPHYTMAKATVRFVRKVHMGAPEEEAERPASRGTRQRSQSAHHGPACKARPGPPPYTSAAWPATAVAGRPAAWQPPPAAAAARPGRDRGHTRSPAPRPRPAAAPGRADRNARGSADRRHVSWSDMCSDMSASYSYESGSDSGPGEPTHGQRSWAQPAAAAADGWGHRGARAQRVDHDRPPQYESSPRTRALVFANWSPMGAAAPYLEVPPLIRRDAPEELRGQYIYAQFPIQDSCLFGARPWQILNQHFQKHTSMILAGETLKQILWMKFLRVKLHGGTRAMLVVQWGFLHELRSMETFGTYILLTSYIYVEKNPPPLNK